MINKDDLESGKLYEWRNPQETPYGEADYIFVDQDKNQWLATRRQVPNNVVNSNPLTILITYEYYPLMDADNNLLPAPDNWDDGKPLLKVENRYW